MSKKLIAVDIDEVLSPFISGLVEWHNLQFGTVYRVSDFTSYNFHHIWGGSLETAIDKSRHYFENRDPEVCRPLANAQQVLNRLHQNYELIVVTSRILEHKLQTESWIKEHFPNIFAEIILCNHWIKDKNKNQTIKKSQACLTLGAQYLIDDLPVYVEDAASEGISALLFGNYPWNQQVADHPQIQRVIDWQSVEAFFFPDN